MKLFYMKYLFCTVSMKSSLLVWIFSKQIKLMICLQKVYKDGCKIVFCTLRHVLKLKTLFFLLKIFLRME